MMTDDRGDLLPFCSRCPDQIEIDKATGHWIHVVARNGEHVHRLWNCQRPDEGRYGDPANVATL